MIVPPRPTGPASSRAGRLAVAALLLTAAGPALAEQPAGSQPQTALEAPLLLPSQSDADAALAGLARPAATEAAPVAPAAAPAAAAVAVAAEPPPSDPLLLAVRERLAAPRRGAADQRDSRQALAAFYSERTAPPLWVDAKGLTTRGLAVVGEIAKADDWGLTASAFELPDLGRAGQGGITERADDEIRIGLAVLEYARHARGGRLDPVKLSRFWDMRPQLKPAGAVLAEIEQAKAADAYLRSLHPQHPQFHKLRQALLEARSAKPAPAPKPTEPNPTVRVPDGPALKVGQDHASVVQLRQRLGVPAPVADDADSYDAALAEAVKAFQTQRGAKPTGVLDKATRAALNADARPAGSSGASRQQLLIANMERWRWLPVDMGAFHIWDNVPEYQGRVVDAGKVIHQFRIIVGKVETQTPVFSADMRSVVFQPGWGVPDSIKVKELLPYLRPTQSFLGYGETDTSVLKRHNLVVSIGGRPVDPRAINWQQVDIRRYQFVQPPGASNVLGQVKFLFPNKHDVYMHDTSQRSLFGQARRTYSHGCVRVDNPRRLAEILMQRDRAMPASEVGRLMTGGPQDNSFELRSRFPVHITYFTAVADDDGTIKTYNDIYGHDARTLAALAGRPMAVEPTPDLTVASRVSRPQPRPVQKSQPTDIFAGLFGN